MSDRDRPAVRSWLRPLGEGLVIVVSILLAFWIDAAWDVHSARARTRDHLSAVREELRDNLRILEEAEANCTRVLGANLHLIRLIEPDPDPIPPDSLSRLIGESFMGTPEEFRTAALNASIASGEFAEITSPELQRGLTGWLSGPAAERRRLGAIYDGQIQKTIDALDDVMPGQHMHHYVSGIDMPPSAFPLDVERVLTDPRIEAKFGNLGTLKNFLCQDDRRYLEDAEVLVRLLDAELDG